MSTFYLDYVNGNDATTDTPFGWWSVSATPTGGSAPAAGETATGGTSGSTAILTVAAASWAGAVTIYFYGKSAAFQAETITFTGGATATIAGDFTYCAWKTMTSGATAARIAPGDTIRIAKSTDPTSLGQTAVWTNLSATVTLTSAVTANIETCETAWTASANVTATADTSIYTEGTKSAKLAIAAGFTTGLVAYKTMASTDFSAYQQVSFTIRPSGSISTDGYVQICLCSDTLGATPVNTINVPAMPDNKTYTFTVDTGAALGAAIQSVAVYTTNDFGAKDLYFDNILACKASSAADSLTLNSLISKNSLATGGTEPWIPIRSINGTTVKLYSAHEYSPANDRGYYGTTETVTTYKREPIALPPQASGGSVHQIQDSGTLGSQITFDAGFNSATNAQDGETFYDYRDFGTAYGIDGNAKSYITMNRVNVIRANYGIFTGQFAATTGPFGWVVTAHSLCGNGRGIMLEGIGNTFTVTNLSHNGGVGVDFKTSGSTYQSGNNVVTAININSNVGAGVFYHDTSNSILTVTNICNNANDGLNIDPGGVDNRIYATNIKNNSVNGIKMVSGSNSVTLYNTDTASNGTQAYYFNVDTAKIRVVNGSISEATKVTFKKAYSASGVYMSSYADDPNDNRIYLKNGTIVSQATTRHTASGVAWQMSPTDSERNLNRPLLLSIAKFACTANNLVTVKVWMQKSHATDIAGSLFIPSGQIAGLTTDVTTTKANDTDWEELTATFTPTANGVVEVFAKAWWLANVATQSVYVDDLTITQA